MPPSTLIRVMFGQINDILALIVSFSDIDSTFQLLLRLEILEHPGSGSEFIVLYKQVE